MNDDTYNFLLMFFTIQYRNEHYNFDKRTLVNYIDFVNGKYKYLNAENLFPVFWELLSNGIIKPTPFDNYYSICKVGRADLKYLEEVQDFNLGYDEYLKCSRLKLTTSN